MDLPDQYPEILVDLAGLAFSRAKEYLQPDRAASFALSLAEDIRLKWGGCLLYVPKGEAYERHRRNAAIWRDFNGSNHADLARKYQLTLSVIYDIVATERIRRQNKLFD